MQCWCDHVSAQESITLRVKWKTLCATETSVLCALCSTPAKCEFSFFVCFLFFCVTSHVSTWRSITSWHFNPRRHCMWSSVRRRQSILSFISSVFTLCPGRRCKVWAPWTTKCVFNIFYVSFCLFAPTADGSVAGCVSKTVWFFIINKMSKPKPQSKQIY